MSALARFCKTAAITAMLACAGVAQAGLVTFSSFAAFEAATTARGTDTFTGISTGIFTSSPVNRSAGAYSYRATAAGGFFASGTAANPELSPNTANDAMIFSLFSPGISAIGGNFFTSNISGQPVTGNVNLTAVDTEGSIMNLLVNTSPSTFFGFVSTTSLVSLTVSAGQSTTGPTWASVDNLTLGLRETTSTVPEPATLALAVFALIAAGASARRRT